MSTRAVLGMVRGLVIQSSGLDPTLVRVRPNDGEAPDELHAMIELADIETKSSDGRDVQSRCSDDGIMKWWRTARAMINVHWRGPGAMEEAARFEIFVLTEGARRWMERHDAAFETLTRVDIKYRDEEGSKWVEWAKMTMAVPLHLVVTEDVGWFDSIPIDFYMDGSERARVVVGTPAAE